MGNLLRIPKRSEKHLFNQLVHQLATAPMGEEDVGILLNRNRTGEAKVLHICNFGYLCRNYAEKTRSIFSIVRFCYRFIWPNMKRSHTFNIAVKLPHQRREKDAKLRVSTIINYLQFPLPAADSDNRRHKPLPKKPLAHLKGVLGYICCQKRDIREVS